ncbi:MAG: hypothetical protein ACRD3D_09865 [Terriglobia bacterium]
MPGAFGLLAMCAIFGFAPASAQEMGRPKLPPVINKITSSGTTKGAFTGIVQTLDTKGRVLEVASVNGADTALFPLTKKVKVSSIEGRKLKLASVMPGANVIVTYEQQGARRTVQEITVVEEAPKVAKKKPSSS